MRKTVDPKVLVDPVDILFTVNGQAHSWAQVVESAGREELAQRMLTGGLIRAVPDHEDAYAGTMLGKWFYTYVDVN